MNFYSFAKAIYLTTKWELSGRTSNKKSFAQFQTAMFWGATHPV